VTEDSRAPQRRSAKQLNMPELLQMGRSGAHLPELTLQPPQALYFCFKGDATIFLISCGSCLPFVLPSGPLAGRHPARSEPPESSAGPSFFRL
jgi:hypothetical protein